MNDEREKKRRTQKQTRWNKPTEEKTRWMISQQQILYKIEFVFFSST